MSVLFYRFHSLLLKLLNKGMEPIPSIKTPKEEEGKNILKIFFSFHFIPSSQAEPKERERVGLTLTMPKPKILVIKPFANVILGRLATRANLKYQSYDM